MIKKEILLTEALACGYTLKSAAALAKVSVEEATVFCDENFALIELRKEEINETCGITNPVKRIEMLNKVANSGIYGYTIMNKRGEACVIQNPAVTVAAIKTYNDMELASAPSTSNVGEIEFIIKEFYDTLFGELKDHKATVERIKQELPEQQELVEELLAGYNSK